MSRPLVILELTLEGEPIEGVEIPTRPTLDGRPRGGVPVLETSHAGAVDAHQRTVGTTDAAGRLLWAPDAPGVAVMEMDGHKVWVGVAPASQAPGLLAGGFCFALLAAAATLLWRARA